MKELFNDKKKLIIVGGISLVSILLLIIIIIFIMSIFKRFDYQEIEKKLVDSAKIYVQKHQDIIPPEEGEFIVSTESLVSEKLIKELEKISKDKSCTGEVTVKYENDSLRFIPQLMCDNYTTTSLKDTILSREEVLDELADEEITDPIKQSGLYKHIQNEEEVLIYRGKKTINNYVRFLDYNWRIFKMDDERIFIILADTLNPKELFQFDDRYNEEIKAPRGKNSFQTSKIYQTLMDVYDDTFKEHHAYLKTMSACVNQRSQVDARKDGYIECKDLFDTPIALLSVYDYMNASLDKNCNKTSSKESRSCSNDNYLANATNKWWLLNGAYENSYDVYYVGINGAIDSTYANDKKDIRMVIAIPSDVIYKDGIGTSDKPFTFYEY